MDLKNLSELKMHLGPKVKIHQEGQVYVFIGPQQQEAISIDLPNIDAFLTLLQTEGITGFQVKELLLKEGVLNEDGISLLIENLRNKCLIQFGLEFEDQTCAYLEFLGEETPIEIQEISPDSSFSWSSFALIRKEQGIWLIENPLSKLSFRIVDPRLWELIFLLSKPITVEELVSKTTLSEAFVRYWISWFSAVTLLEIEEASTPTSTVLKQWSFHDLYFHSRSRFGRTNDYMGATYRFKDEFEPPPVVKPLPPGPFINLPRFDPRGFTNPMSSFNDVLEGRVSKRNSLHGVITFYQLSEFLFRAARVRMIYPDKQPMQLSNRPYPSGGASYELEIYLTVYNCLGLNPGFYHYCPLNHRFTLVSPPNAETAALLKDAMWATGKTASPQVLIHLSARFQRVSWKYDAMAYAATLKNTGVLFQTFYLVATAMNLSPCAIGLGNSDRFSKLAGVAYLEESSVGEFILGGS